MKLPKISQQDAVLAGNPVFVDKRNLAKRLAVSRSLIDRLVMERKIPFIKIGRSIRFDVAAVLEALRKKSC